MLIPANPGRIIRRKAISSAYTLTAHDEYVVASANATVTLMAAADVPAGQEFMFGVTVNASVTLTVTPAGSDTIGGVAGSLSLTSTAGMLPLVSDGVSNWESIKAGS